MVQKEGRVQKIDSDDTQRLLLQLVLVIQHSNMQDDLAVVIARVSLVFYAHPAVAFVGAMKITRRDGVGEGEEAPGLAARWPQTFQVEPVLIIQHALQPRSEE